MNEIENEFAEIKIGHLLAIIGRTHANRADQYMERIGLYRGQAVLLIILSRQDGLTHSELAERLDISPAAVTKVIKRLEAMHYVQRRSDPKDERLSRVYLQEEGWAVIQQIKNAFAQIDKILLQNLSPQEQAALMKLLRQLYENLIHNPLDPA